MFSVNTKTELLSLTGLRFVAAFYVFLFHMQIRWPIANHRFMKNILEQGAIGMSLFFMLSGFVLAYQYADSRVTYKTYLLNRFARIYPVYFLAALVTLPWIGVSVDGGSLTPIAKEVGQLILLLFTNLFLIQAWFPQLFSYWNDGGSWSISVEAFCYLLLPFLLPILARCSLPRLHVIALICLLLAVLPGISAVLFNSPMIGLFYSVPIFRLPEFLIGTCLCLSLRLEPVIRGGVLTQLLVLLAFLAYLGVAGSKMPMYVGHNWIALPVIAFMIYTLATGQGPLAALLASRPLVWLGKVSYCFYSFQILVILALVSYHDALIQAIPLLANNRTLAITSLAVLVALSGLGYHFIEEPARRWIRRYHTGYSLSRNTQIRDCEIVNEDSRA